MKNKFKKNEQFTFGKGFDNDIVEYNCPDCGHRNIHKWYGTEKHICEKCENITLIKVFK